MSLPKSRIKVGLGLYHRLNSDELSTDRFIISCQLYFYSGIKKVKKVKAVDLYSASSCMPKAGIKPPLMHSRHGPGAAGHTSHRPQPAHTDLGANRPLARQRQSAVGLHLRNPSLMDYYSFNRPPRDGRLSGPCWLTDSGHFTHKVVTRPAVSLAQDRESTPAEPAVEPLCYAINVYWFHSFIHFCQSPL